MWKALRLLPVSILVSGLAAAADEECADFVASLDACSAYTCTFTHWLTQEKMQRQIVGYDKGECRYVEQMPNGGKLECSYSDAMRKAVAQYYADVEAENEGRRYSVDGKEVDNPAQEALAVGQCKVTGYGDR